MSLEQFEGGKKSTAVTWSIQSHLDGCQMIIDILHIANHKDKTCHELYSPEMFKKENPDVNTMCCEQTFTWLSRYKRILHPCPKHTIIFICTEWSGEETVTSKSVMLMDVGHCCQTLNTHRLSSLIHASL